MLWELSFLAISASLVLKFEISASKLVDSLRPHIFSTLKRNFSIFDFFDFWETPFSAISASLVLKFEISASKLVDSVRPHIFSTLKRNFSIFDFFDALGNSFFNNFSVPGVEIRTQRIEISRLVSTSHFFDPKTQLFDF